MAKDTAGDAFVQFDRVQKSYDGETLVVKDLNLEMPRGEFLTMLGPTGLKEPAGIIIRNF